MPEPCSEVGGCLLIDGFCQRCGRHDGGGTVIAVGLMPSRAHALSCPVCAEAREASRHCPICLYDYQEEAAFDPERYPLGVPSAPLQDSTPVVLVVLMEAMHGACEVYRIPLPYGVPLEVGRGSRTAEVEPGRLCIADPGISREHLRLVVGKDGVRCTDKGSSNGTLLDGTPMQAGIELLVERGSRLLLGESTILQLSYGEHP